MRARPGHATCRARTRNEGPPRCPACPLPPAVQDACRRRRGVHSQGCDGQGCWGLELRAGPAQQLLGACMHALAQGTKPCLCPQQPALHPPLSTPPPPTHPLPPRRATARRPGACRCARARAGVKRQPLTWRRSRDCPPQPRDAPSRLAQPTMPQPHRTGCCASPQWSPRRRRRLRVAIPTVRRQPAIAALSPPMGWPVLPPIPPLNSSHPVSAFPISLSFHPCSASDLLCAPIL